MNVGATALPNLGAQRGAVRRVLDVLPSIVGIYWKGNVNIGNRRKSKRARYGYNIAKVKNQRWRTSSCFHRHSSVFCFPTPPADSSSF